MTSIGLNTQTVMLREITQTRARMDNLQKQMATGKKAETYGGLGNERNMALALRQDMAQTESFRNSITLANTRVKVMTAAVDQMRDQASDLRGQILVSGFETADDTGKTLAMTQAKSRLSGVVELLNTDIGGRHLFAGTKTDGPPVASAERLLEGSGGQAGFKQIMSERLQADLGAGTLGRLAISAPVADSVSIAEDVAGSPFGLKLKAVSSGMDGALVNGPAGAPAAVDIGFGPAPALPQDGQQIKLTLGLPDGSAQEITLTAKNDGELKPGEFAIGADGAATATNFRGALTSAITEQAATTLQAASMQAAANDFFTTGTNTPQRVDGPPFDTASGLRAATPDDTLSWYTGERSDSPARESAIVRADDQQLIAYGARADETGFADMVKQLAVMASASFDADKPGDQKIYNAMSERVMDGLAQENKARSIDRVLGEMALAQGTLGEANERHQLKDNLTTNFLADIETADMNEVGAGLLSLQTRLQASYQVTSMLSKLSLVNYM